MGEEFEESEVVFQENDEDRNPNCVTPEFSRKRNPKRKSVGKKEKVSSVPVSIPEYVSRYQCVETALFDGEDDDEDLVPPHVMVGRRIYAGKVAYSVCSGTGRTLKGRDLSEVRNSILRLTGFLET